MALGASDLAVLEPKAEWAELQPWMRAFIGFGHAWSNGGRGRALAFISTPFDSPAAGLIALGAVLHRMGLPDANDLGSHFNRLVTLAKSGRTSVYFRHRSRHRTGRWAPVVRADGSVWLRQDGIDHPESQRLLEASAQQWMPDGEPPVEAYDAGAQLPFAAIYEKLIPPGATLLSANLSRGDSAVVLAGRAMGMNATRKNFASLAFRATGVEATLADLLSVHDWSPRFVSRTRHLSPRVQETTRGKRSRFDRPGVAPSHVVADGAAALQVALKEHDCEHADIFAVLPPERWISRFVSRGTRRRTSRHTPPQLAEQALL